MSVVVGRVGGLPIGPHFCAIYPIFVMDCSGDDVVDESIHLCLYGFDVQC